jgi:hypothetical protein
MTQISGKLDKKKAVKQILIAVSPGLWLLRDGQFWQSCIGKGIPNEPWDFIMYGR